MASLTRRDALYKLQSASIGGILPARPQDPSSATSSATRNERHDFEHVRDRILKATASGAATGVAVALVHRGRIVWEEGFGWENRETAVKATSPYAVQPRIPHQTLRHHDSHDPGCRGQTLFGRSRK